MLDELYDKDNAKIILYRDLASHPEKVVRELFDFTGLAWHPQTEHFLRSMTTSNPRSRYFSLRRHAVRSVYGWREELSRAEKEIVLGVASKFEVGGLFE